jgi:hypothetical protein
LKTGPAMFLQKLKSLESNVVLLAGLLVIWVVALFVGEIWFKEDGQFFQVVSGLVTAFSAALLAMLNPKVPPKPEAPKEEEHEKTP